MRAEDYRAAHQRIFGDPVARRAASPLLARLRTPDLMWGQLRSVATGSGSWALRRNAAHELIDPVIDTLHGENKSPLDALVTLVAARLDAESVRDAWRRALERRGEHPEGAITMARTLLESTLKTILDDRNLSYRETDDLPGLYKAVSGELGLSPGSHSEQAFRQILGGCHSVVVGLGSLRNKAGDAHAAGRTHYGWLSATPLSRSTSLGRWPCSSSRRTRRASSPTTPATASLVARADYVGSEWAVATAITDLD